MKMKKIIGVLALIAISSTAFAQKYSTKIGSVSFHSRATLEDIDAQNNQVSAALNAATGEVAFVVLIKSFEFDKALMQTHFNDTYMESDKTGYDKSTFSGTITNNSSVKYVVNGSYNVSVSGTLKIHGVSKEVTTSGTIAVNGSTVTITSSFKVKLDDYAIKNDKVKNIANEIEVKVNCALSKI